MRRCAVLLGGLALWLAWAGSAAAQDGAGLYEPFPEPAGPAVVRAFVGELPAPGARLARKLTAAQLERGYRVTAAELGGDPALPVVAAGGPGERGEPGEALGSAAGWLGAGALVALACGAALRLAGRRPLR
jgi:hypothetical protein